MHTRLISALGLALLATAQVMAQTPAPATPLPVSLDPPPPARLDLSVSAKGVQIYRCSIGDDGPAWTLFAPEASLYEGATATGPVAGTHGAGPSWRWNDGSAIAGRVRQKQPSPDPKSVPWLLLSATPTADSAATGRLHGITWIRRSDTAGGTAPAKGCDPKHFNAEVRIPYTATYTFYR